MRRAVVLVGVLVVVAVGGPWVAPYGPVTRFENHMHAPPMRLHVDGTGFYTYPLRLVDRLEQTFVEDTGRRTGLPWTTPAAETPILLLGADGLGRDVLSRTLHGARASLGLALAATAGTLLLGALLGGWAGMAGGFAERAVLKSGDVLMVLPVLYVVVALRSALALVLPLPTVVAVLASIFIMLGWPRVARGVWAIVRIEVRQEHVLAATVLGASRWRIMTRHLLPACTGYLAVQTALLVPMFVLAEATLSYVGLGFPDGVPSWGTALAEAATLTSMSRAPWTLTPAIAMFLVVLVTNVLLEPARGSVASDVAQSG
ncbi:MAG: ABC transporter permease [Acidobacteria bacterium]|nr:ABC transporter permease [Acidobacteriota bacterium]